MMTLISNMLEKLNSFHKNSNKDKINKKLGEVKYYNKKDKDSNRNINKNSILLIFKEIL